MKNNLITFGSDPELMIYSKSDKRVVSALRILDRDKKDPLDLGQGVKMYADNALCEASMPPENSVESMVLGMRSALSKMQSALGRRGNYSLSAQASEFFDDCEMEDEKLWEVGCNPNWDAYREAENTPIPFTDTMRTGSFHIHLGNEMIAGKLQQNPHKTQLIKTLDVYLGCASVIFDRDPTAVQRRRYYGKAGEFRSTDYGVEYRVLGNWPLRSPITTKLCFDLAAYALNLLHTGHAKAACEAVGEAAPQKAINENDKGLAKEVLLKAAMPEEFMQRIFRKHRNASLNQSWGIE